MVADNQASDSPDATQKHETTTQIFMYNSSEKAPTSKPEENNRNKIFGWLKKFFSNRLTLRWLTFATAVGILFFTGRLFYQAIDQAKTSKDIAHRQLRAYLVVIEPQLKVAPKSFFLNIDKRVEMSYIVNNSGQTPAYDVRDSVNIKIWPRGARPQAIPESVRNFNYPVYGPSTQNTRKIHSGDSNILTQRYFIPNTNIFDTVNYGIYFWGRIEYTDIFNESHFTNFCYEFIFDEPIDEFRTYGTCNDADRD